jgi:hypothetical protein
MVPGSGVILFPLQNFLGVSSSSTALMRRRGEEGVGIKENDGGGEFKYDIVDIF